MTNLLEQQAMDKIEKAGGSWEAFCDWIIGQTAPIINGKLGYYKYDVDRFIRYKCDPKNESYIEWD